MVIGKKSPSVAQTLILQCQKSEKLYYIETFKRHRQIVYELTFEKYIQDNNNNNNNIHTRIERNTALLWQRKQVTFCHF